MINCHTEENCLFLIQSEGCESAFDLESPWFCQSQKTLSQLYTLYSHHSVGRTLHEMIENASTQHKTNFQVVVILHHGYSDGNGLENGPSIHPEDLGVPSSVRSVVFLSCYSDRIARVTSATNHIQSIGFPSSLNMHSLFFLLEDKQIFPISLSQDIPFIQFDPENRVSRLKFNPDQISRSLDAQNAPPFLRYRFSLHNHLSDQNRWLDQGVDLECEYTFIVLHEKILTDVLRKKEDLETLKEFPLKILEKAAAKRNNLANFALGKHYLALKDQAKAIQFFAQGAKLGHGPSSSQLELLRQPPSIVATLGNASWEIVKIGARFSLGILSAAFGSCTKHLRIAPHQLDH